MDNQAYPLPSSLFPLANALSNGIALHRDGQVLFANKAFSQLTGYAPDDLAKLDFWALFPPEVQAEARQRERLGPDDEPVPARYEALVQTRQGEARWVELSLSQQAVQGIATTLCILVDITDRKRAEEALRRVHTDLEAQVENRTAELQQAKASLEDDIARREGAELELLKRYAELTELNCLLHETQQQLVQSEKLASIGQLAAGVAHEINNPIGYVSSNIRSLQDYITRLFQVLDVYQATEAALPDAARARIDKIKHEADFDYLRDDIHELIRESAEGTERVRKIVQDLRDFSRSDTAQQWQAADLHMGLDSTLNIASNEIKYRADVVREYGAIPLVECLPSQLNQVFMNLVVNAAQAIEGSGEITVTTGRVGDDSVQVSIADTGKGISPEGLRRLFEPFYTTKPVGEGTGLGLTLSREIVQRHRGQIEVNSELGKGTVFTLTLPIDPVLDIDADTEPPAAAV